jgi:aldehyde dehydrogenase (NAD+)
VFLEQLKAAVVAFYGEDPQQNPDYGRIINLHHFDRPVGLLASGDV